MPVRGLTIVVAGADRDRFRTALTLAASQAALGGAATLFLDGSGAALPFAAYDDPPPGLPSVAELIDTALELGARIVVCQSGLAAAGLSLADRDARIESGGLPGLLSGLGDDRLVAL